MATTALGIMQASDGAGLDPLTHRRIIKGRWANTGVVAGLAVTGRSDLSYQVAAGVAVASRSGSDGYVELYFEGGTAGPVEAGDPSNPRIDAVWVKANDIQQGDPDNRVHVGVTQGTPSASPVCPSVPAGCLVLAKMRVPASATSTGSAQRAADGDRAIPYGASLGLLGMTHETESGVVDERLGVKGRHCSVQITVPTKRVVELRFTASAYSQGDPGTHSSWYVAFALDGEEIPYSGGESYLGTLVCETVQRSWIVEVPAGTHTVSVSSAWVAGENQPMIRAGSYTSNPDTGSSFSGQFAGKILEAWDRGVAQ